MENKLLETVADIAFYAGQKGYYSGDSRADIADFIWWAKEFEIYHKDTDWERTDYMLAIEAFALNKLEVTSNAEGYQRKANGCDG